MSVIISRGDRMHLLRWVKASFPELEVKEVYRGFYVYKAGAGGLDKDETPRILVRNDRHVVSYNPQTGRTYSQLGPRGGKWRQRLQISLATKFEKLWGIQNDQ